MNTIYDALSFAASLAGLLAVLGVAGYGVTSLFAGNSGKTAAKAPMPAEPFGDGMIPEEMLPFPDSFRFYCPSGDSYMYADNVYYPDNND